MQPDAIAVVDQTSKLSYAVLNQRANQLAHYLRGLGISPDDRVAIYFERNIDLLVAILAILKAGAGYVPIPHTAARDQLAYIIEDSSPVAVLTQSALRGQLRDLPMPVLVLEDLAQALAGLAGTDLDDKQIGLQTQHLAYIIYTSGSTGRPKGVMVEHASVVNLVHDHARICELVASDNILQFASIGFDAHVGEIFPALSVGATLVIRPSDIIAPDAAFVSLLQQHRITVSDQPSAFWHQWVQEMTTSDHVPDTSLRLIIAGGEKVEHRFLRRWLAEPRLSRCRWMNTYGPTEATVVMTAITYDSDSVLPPIDVPIGRPIANARVYVLDQAQQLLPIGVTGELYIGGPGVARG
ncbi:non-ribosomal peptide synthetase, partial [Xanthomonas sontii]